MMQIGIAGEHGGFALKEQMAELLRGSRHDVVDFGAHQLTPDDNYRDSIIPLAQAVASKEVEHRGRCVGAALGASIAAKKVADVRAELVMTFLRPSRRRR